MTLKKVVDGVEMDMSPEEEAAITQEWKANADQPKVEVKSLQQQIDELKAMIAKQ